MKKLITTLSLFIFAFSALLTGQSRTDVYIKNNILKELSLSKNSTTGVWDTSSYTLNQLSPQCAILKSSLFYQNSSTNRLYESSRDSVVYLTNGGVDVYTSSFNFTTNTLDKSNRQRIRVKSKPNLADTMVFQAFSSATNTYVPTEFALVYFNKWGQDSFVLTRAYVNNVLADTVLTVNTKTDVDGNYTYFAWAFYQNRQLSSFNQRTGYTYVNKKLITRRDTSVGSVSSYYSVTDYSYDANGQVTTELSTNTSSSDTTKNYNRTRYIARNIKNKPLETIFDQRINGVWVEDYRHLFTYQADTLETLNQNYIKSGTQWIEVGREIHAYCLSTPNAVASIDNNLDIVLSPNPTNGYLSGTFTDKSTAQMPFDVAIFNNSGQLVFEQKQCNDAQPINISQLNDGFYVVKMVQNGRFKASKLIVQH
jgi:Secretion system C-terminal sorting domain